MTAAEERYQNFIEETQVELDRLGFYLDLEEVEYYAGDLQEFASARQAAIYLVEKYL
jgi:hypothetical protein